MLNNTIRNSYNEVDKILENQVDIERREKARKKILGMKVNSQRHKLFSSNSGIPFYNPQYTNNYHSYYTNPLPHAIYHDSPTKEQIITLPNIKQYNNNNVFIPKSHRQGVLGGYIKMI